MASHPSSHQAGHTHELALNVAARVPVTEAEGPGLRYALWVQGCHLRCPGCCNPHMLSFEDVEWMNPEVLAAEICDTPGIEGLTIVGGEPFAQARALSRLTYLVQQAGLSVMVFSGYTLEHLHNADNTDYDHLLTHIDLLIDGPYLKKQRVTDRRWIGSSNQRVHFLTDRYADLRDSETGWNPEANTVEIRLSGDVLTINGFPHSEITDMIDHINQKRVKRQNLAPDK